jgi:hypothetical protein
MDEVQFVCAACEKTYEGDCGAAVTECRVCKRLHCKGCVDEFGRCGECADSEKGKGTP